MSALPRPVPTDANPSPEAVTVALRAFFRAAALWDLSNEQSRTLLGQPGRATFFQWKRGVVKTVPFDTVRRISWILGIYKALQILFSDPDRADAWLKKPNELLGGQSALDRMLAGDITDLAFVRRVLDAVRGGGA